MGEADSSEEGRKLLADELRLALGELEAINTRLGTMEERPDDLERAQSAAHKIMNLSMASRRWTESLPGSSEEK